MTDCGRTIIAGSRNFNSYPVMSFRIMRLGVRPSVVISGTAGGADRLGEKWAELHNVPVHLFPADWNEYGKKAGYIRNEEMADNADTLIAFWDGKSRGTGHMIDIARRKGLTVHVEMV